MKDKTKILAVADIHGDTGLVKKLAKQAKDEDVDVVILAGDLTWLEQSNKNLIGAFVKQGKEVLIMPGNHETMLTINELTKKYPNTKNIHGEHFKKNNLGIFGAGYSINAGPFVLNENEILSHLEKSHDPIKDLKKKIMVTHMHHSGSQSEFTGFPGSKSISKAIKKFKPDIVLSGHIHEAGGLYEKIGRTKIFNVSRKPIIFEI